MNLHSANPRPKSEVKAQRDPATNYRTLPQSADRHVPLPERQLVPVPENRKPPAAVTSDLLPHEIRPDQTTLLDRYLWPIPKVTLSERIMSRLCDLEAAEGNPHLADDYRLAWLTVFLASDKSRTWDNIGPWEFAFCSMFGKHPDKAIPYWVSRAAKDAEMQFGKRKPVQSDKSAEKKTEAA